MRPVNITEANKNLSELIEAANRGEEIIVTKDDQPIGKIVPFKRVRRAGSAKQLVTISKDFDKPLEEFKNYM